MQPMKGCKPIAVETEEELPAVRGLSPKPVMPPPIAGLVMFVTLGGIPELQKYTIQLNTTSLPFSKLVKI